MIYNAPTVRKKQVHIAAYLLKDGLHRMCRMRGHWSNIICSDNSKGVCNSQVSPDPFGGVKLCFKN